MAGRRRWTKEMLVKAVSSSKSLRQVINKLGLVEAGGNYTQVKRYIHVWSLNDSHFHGKAWNKGLVGIGKPLISLKEILVIDSSYQSFKLKRRLFKEGIKKQECEECGWRKKSEDGRVPLELDHINGNNRDNRLVNLRVLCPNCHSLKPTHRGRNRKKKAGSVAE